jgi:hypothetical protein
MRAQPRFVLLAALFTSGLALFASPSRARADDAKTDDTKGGDTKGGANASTTATTQVAGNSTDVTEQPGKKYFFIGVRYRHTIVPKFVQNLFVKEGATAHSNSIGFELDMRKDEFSLIPSLNYSEFGLDDTLYLQANKSADDPGNWSYVNSSMKSINAGLDLMWTVYSPDPKWQIEAGIGFAFGMVFGDLVNNWVTSQAQGGRNPDFVSSDGRKFWKCQSQTDGPGCAIGNHNGATVAKVGNYVEPSWFNGGSMPPLYAHFIVPAVGVRFKPVKQFTGRLGFGLNIPFGFWFGLSADYGLEQPDKKTSVASLRPRATN